VTLSNSANIVADGETKDRFSVCWNKKIRYPGYEISSNHVFKEDLIMCWICMRNELWSGYKALHIFGLFSNNVFKINFDSLSYCSKMIFDLLLIVDAIIGTKVEQSSFFEQFESGSISFSHLMLEQSQNRYCPTGGSKFMLI